MSERKESSVLFSLRELQTIEEERVQEEADEVTRAEAAANAAKEAQERQVRDDEEARRSAAELAEKQARDAVEQRQREEQLRPEETERRARVEAQAQLEQQRLAKEMELRHIEAKRKKPAWIIAVIVSAVVLGLIAMLFLNASNDRKKAENAERVRVALVKKIQKEMTLAQIDIDNAEKKMDEAFEALTVAKTEEAKVAAGKARADAKKELADKKAELQRLKERAAKVATAKKKAKKKREKREIDKCAKSNDPLCGL